MKKQRPEKLQSIVKVIRVESTNFTRQFFFYYRDWTDCTLTTAVRWLLRQCGRPQAECRHRCMAMFFTLSASLPGSSGPKDVIQALLSEQGPAYIIARLVAAKTGHLLG